MTLRELAQKLAQEVQDVVGEFVEEHGRKRGLYAFARAVGVSERRAQSLYHGSAGRLHADEYKAALLAKSELTRLRVARLRLELARLESLEQGRANAMDQDALGGNADRDRAHLEPTRTATGADPSAPSVGRDCRDVERTWEDLAGILT